MGLMDSLSSWLRDRWELEDLERLNKSELGDKVDLSDEWKPGNLGSLDALGAF